MNLEYWRGKRVLVTGADGFIGSHLTERLSQFGARVSIVVRSSSVSGTTQYQLKNIPESLAARIQNIYCCDIATADSIHFIAKSEPEVIYHIASAAYVPFSFDHPFEHFHVNVTGTLHVLEAARRLTKIERLVITSSSEVYGPKTVDNIDESHPLNPTSPYAASKVAADRYCYAYSVMCGLPVSIARMFNTFGPRQIYDVVPRFVQMALRGEPITVFGTGEQTRDFMYVTDAVNALLTMGADPRARLRTVNFGTGREISIRSLAKLVKELTGSRSEVVFLPRRTSEVEGLCCNAGLASALLEWRPCVRFEDGLARTIEWARERQQYVARQR